MRQNTESFLAISTVLVVMAFLFYLPAKDKIANDKAVECIIGEAEGEKYFGKLALAFALRNRGTTMGVYGCTSKRVKERLYSQDVLIQARRAWAESIEGHDPTHGADHWLSTDDEWRKMSWVGNCEPKTVIGGHIFFKCP